MTNNQNSGCLHSILGLLGIRPQSARSRLKVEEIESEVSLDDLPYLLRDDFLSPAELSFYHVLRTVIGSRAMICPKVGLGEIFFVARPHENYAFRGRIAQKHLDFLLCNPKTMQPILGIELDDSSHARPDRQERDMFVNKVFEAADLPLLHLPAKRNYSAHELADTLAKYMDGVNPQPVTASTETEKDPHLKPKMTNGAPLCPKCDVPMVVRTVAKGEHKGKQFYGCTNYPRCREVLAIKQ